MAWSLLNGNKALSDSASSVSSIALAYPSSTTSGSLLVAVFDLTQTVGQTTSVSDTIGNAWSKALSEPLAVNNDCQAQIYYCVNKASGTNTVTVTPGTAGFCDLAIFEYSGNASTSPLDTHNNGSYTTTTSVVCTTSGTTSQANELVVAVAADISNGAAFTASTGYQITEDNTGGNGNNIATADNGTAYTNTSGSTPSVTLTRASSGTGVWAIATFLPSSGGGGASTPTATLKVLRQAVNRSFTY